MIRIAAGTPIILCSGVLIYFRLESLIAISQIAVYSISSCCCCCSDLEAVYRVYGDAGIYPVIV